MAQIGEDVKLLTHNTRNALTHFDYRMLIYFRNMVDHTYEKVNKEVLKAYIFNIIDKKAIDQVKNRIEYCIKASKEETKKDTLFHFHKSAEYLFYRSF